MEQLDEQTKLRKYLLNDISENNRSEIEERLLTDDEYFEEISMAEENLIQDYADRNLDADEQERFEKYFLSSEENREKVRFARALRKYVNESKTANETNTAPEAEKNPSFFDSLKGFFSSPVPAALAVLVIAGIIGFFVWRSSSSDSDVLIALNKFQKSSRPTVARITGFDYAPKIEGTRGEANKNNEINLLSAKLTAQKAIEKGETAENLHELGLVYLAEKNFDEAAKLFEKALNKAPNNAKIHNDLGVALMEKADLQEVGAMQNLTRASEEFGKAISLDKSLLEAYFNKALCLEKIPGSPQAKEAWQDYLKLDSNSQWAEEARAHLGAIETNQPISKTKEQVLQEFLEAKQTGDDQRA